MQVSPENQDKEDLNDTIESLVVNLAKSQEHQVLGKCISIVNFIIFIQAATAWMGLGGGRSRREQEIKQLSVLCGFF